MPHQTCLQYSTRLVYFQDYPSVLAQAVYAAFCESFPDSYRQFGEPFKEDLVALVYEWVAGEFRSTDCFMNKGF